MLETLVPHTKRVARKLFHRFKESHFGVGDSLPHSRRPFGFDESILTFLIHDYPHQSTL